MFVKCYVLWFLLKLVLIIVIIVLVFLFVFFCRVLIWEGLFKFLIVVFEVVGVLVVLVGVWGVRLLVLFVIVFFVLLGVCGVLVFFDDGVFLEIVVGCGVFMVCLVVGVFFVIVFVLMFDCVLSKMFVDISVMVSLLNGSFCFLCNVLFFYDERFCFYDY